MKGKFLKHLRAVTRHALRAALVVAMLLGCDATPSSPQSTATDAGGDVATPPQLQFAGRVGVLDLPAQVANAQGLTAHQSLELPGETLAATLISTGATGRVAVAAWRDGGGQELVAASWLAGPLAPWLCTQGCVFRQQSRPLEQALLVPNAPRMVTLAGVHQLQALHLVENQGQLLPAPGPMQLQVVAVRGPPLSAGRLPVNLCLTGALGWTAQNASTLPRLQQAIATATQIMAQAQVELQVTVREVSGAAPLVEHSSDDVELITLFKTGAKLPLGVNVFLVEQVYTATNGVQAPITGISGGIPGPPLHMGTPGAGIAVSLALGPGEDDRLGLAIAHEIGHFLGLFHTTEVQVSADPPLHDDLDDTPGDGQDNLMYWAPQAGATKLSPQQGQILRNSPWVQALP